MVSLAAILGGLPDLVRFLQKDSSDWTKNYAYIHDYHSHKWLLLIPYLNIHILEDYQIHNRENPYGWHWWAYIVEIITDTAMLFLVFLIIWGTI